MGLNRGCGLGDKRIAPNQKMVVFESPFRGEKHRGAKRRTTQLWVCKRVRGLNKGLIKHPPRDRSLFDKRHNNICNTGSARARSYDEAHRSVRP